MDLLFVSSVAASVFNVGLGFFLLRENPKNKTNLTFSGYLFSLSLWIFGDIFHYTSVVQLTDPINIVKFIHIGAILAPAFFLHFIFEFTKTNYPRWVLIFPYGFSGLFLIFNFFGDFFIESVSVSGQKLVLGEGPLYTVFWIQIAAFLVFSYFLMYKKYVNSTGHLKQQIKYFFIGTVIIILAALFYVPTVVGNSALRVDNIFHILYPAVIGYSITKHNLLDIKVVVKKTGAFVVTSVFLLITLVLIALIPIQNTGVKLALLVFGGWLWAFAAKPLQALIVTTARRAFVKNWYDPTEVIHNLSSLLTPVYTYEDAVQIVVNVLDETIEPEYIEYRERLVGNEVIKFEVGSEGHHKGFIVLGDKDSGDKYTEEDLKFIETAISQFNLVLDRLVPYEKIKTQYEKNREYTEKVKQQVAYANLTKGIAHEIKNPLRMIQSGFEILEMSTQNADRIKEFSTIIADATSRLFAMLDVMIKFGDVAIGEKSTFSVNAFVKDVLFLAQGRLTENEIKLDTQFGEETEMVADQAALQQILVNIMTNSIEALESIPDNRWLKISTYPSTFSKDAGPIPGFVIELEDNGPGIPQNEQDKIFDSFYTTKHENQGLGLPTVLKIVEQHNGKIEIESPIQGETGTKVKIFMPLGTQQ